MTASPYSGTTSVHHRDFDLFGSIRRRVIASIAATVGWLSLTLLFLAFWAHAFSLLQSIVVVIVSLLILGGFLLGAWVSFGMKFVSD
ncbi:MAG TPA: hypothetical protein VK423_01825 [Thermoplasmata archaeon]|nr:hypothetical protein [Thermoplasmata archaeon]